MIENYLRRENYFGLETFLHNTGCEIDIIAMNSFFDNLDDRMHVANCCIFTVFLYFAAISLKSKL